MNFSMRTNANASRHIVLFRLHYILNSSACSGIAVDTIICLGSVGTIINLAKVNIIPCCVLPLSLSLSLSLSHSQWVDNWLSP